MIVDRKIEVTPDGVIKLTNRVDPSALLAIIHEQRQETAKQGGLAAKGFSQDKNFREIGWVTPSMMVAHPLLKEGLQRAQGRSVRLLGLVVGLPKEGEVNQLSLDLL